MILCSKRKFCIFLSPKTGTVSLTEIFKNLGVEEAVHDHSSYKEIQYRIDNGLNIEGYRFFCFYRDPVDRCRSMITHFMRKRCREFFPLLYGNSVPFSILDNRTYGFLSSDLQEKIDSVPMIDVFRKMNHFKELVYGKQIDWLNFDKIEYLNFHQYESQVKFLLETLDFDSNIDIPKYNTSIKNTKDFLSDDDVSEIKEYYKEDYEFFNSRGIVFNK